MTDLNSLTGRSDNYRTALGSFIDHEIVLDCSSYRIVNDDVHGRTLLVLEKPTVIKVAGRTEKKPWTIGHLWVIIPKGDVRRIEKYRHIARKIRIEGRVREYRYKETELTQVGVHATKVSVLKYKKEIAKKFKLVPGQQLTKQQLKQIRIEANRIRIISELRLEQEELRRIAIAAALHKKMPNELELDK